MSAGSRGIRFNIIIVGTVEMKITGNTKIRKN
jgi:hypothetical protein